MSAYREWRMPCWMRTRGRIGNEIRAVTITSISETGCSIAGAGPWPKDETVALLYCIPPVTARIMRSDSSGCGMRFDRRLARGEVAKLQDGTAGGPGRFTEIR